MLLRSWRLAVGLATVAATAAVAVPLAAHMLAGASVGSEVVLGAPSLAVAGGIPYAVGSDGTNFAVFGVVFGGQRVSPDGTLLDPKQVAFPYVPGGGSTNGASLAVAPSGGNYLAVWNVSGGVSMAHLDSTLAGVEPVATRLASIPSQDEAYVAIAKGASGYLVAWIAQPISQDGSKGTINAQLLDATGAPQGPALTLGPGDPEMFGPSVSYGGGSYEVVWGAGANLAAARVSEAGVLLDATPKTIATTFDWRPPFIAATGKEHVVVWRDEGRDGGAAGTFAARIAFDGTVLDPGGVAVVASAEPSGLAYAPSTGLVMGWTPWGGHPPTVGILDETALTIHGERALPGETYTAPSLASNGTTVLAVWSNGTTTGAVPIDGNASPVVLGFVQGQNTASQIASSGSGYFAAWATGAPIFGSGGTIWGRLLDATGKPIGQPILVSVPPHGWVGAPQVVWTGAEYVVLWPVDQNVWYTVRVDPNGKVLDSDVGNIDVPTNAAVTFTGGNGHFFEIVTTGGRAGEVDIYPYDGTPGSGYFAAGTPTKIFFTAGESAVAWLDATRFELVFTGGPGLYASVFDTTTMKANDPVTVAQNFDGYVRPLAARGQYETLVGATPVGAGSTMVYRLDDRGAVIDGPYPTQSPSGGSTPSLVWDGARYVLAWSEPGDGGGTVAYASDLGSDASPFTLSGPLPAFGEDIAAPGPSIVPLGNGSALVVATRAADTSVVGAPWKSGDKLPPLPIPMPDAGPDASPDAATDAEADASSDAGNPVDAAGPLDSGSIADAGNDAAKPVPKDAGGAASDAGQGEDGGSAGNGDGSGCSCRVGADENRMPWDVVAGALLAGLALAARRRSR